MAISTQRSAAPSIGGLTSNSRYRIKDAGLRNREENLFSPSDAVRSLTLTTLCNQTLVQCTESFPLLEDGQAQKASPIHSCRGMGTGLSASYGSLSRAAAMTHSAVRGESQEPLIGAR